MKIQKRHIVLSALIIALAAAVYLNWHFTSDGALLSPTAKELGAATYVNADTTATADEVLTTSKTLTKEAQYFAEAETEREQAQDKALDEAKEILKLADSTDDAKEDAVEQANGIEDRILAQSNIENLLKAKGFSRCLCFIGDSGCTVSVLKSEMTSSSALIIKDIVASQIEIEFNNVTIIEV